jgi:hypothetical protein
MFSQQIISTLPFKHWLWQDNENKRLLVFVSILIVAAIIWLKILYPYPNFMPPDSYSYLEAANTNQFINVWPIGYSKFLRLVSVFSRSHILLIVVQYFLLQASLLYLLFTIRYLLLPTKWIFRSVLIISVLNPLMPHIANFVSSDSLFTTLSLVWFTQLLWILYHPTPKLMMLHALVLLLAFTVRFSGIYYPLISILIILLTGMPKKNKFLGIGSITFMLFAFIGRTQYEYKIKTDTIQYSAFGGWQIAANALYGYAYAKPDAPSSVLPKFRNLHKLVNQHMDSLRHMPTYIRPDNEVAIYYLWNFKSPLRKYMFEKWGKYDKKVFLKHWASLGPEYQEYGRYLIAKHPREFFIRFVWPNLLRYYAPPPYFMENYNMGNTKVDSIAVSWFDWKTNELPVRVKDRRIHIVSFFSILLSVINPSFLLATIFLFFSDFSKRSRISKNIISCMLLVWFSNTIFSVLSAPIELRYQLFPIAITLPFTLLFLSWIINSLQFVSNIKNKQSVSLHKPIT